MIFDFDFEICDYHVSYCELCIFTASSMLDDVCEEEDVLKTLTVVIRWNAMSYASLGYR